MLLSLYSIRRSDHGSQVSGLQSDVCNQRYIKNTIGVICMFIPCGIFQMPGNISNIVEYNFPLTLRNLIDCVKSLNAKHNITIYS